MSRRESSADFAVVSKDAYVSWEMKQLYLAAKKLGYHWVVVDPRHTSFDVTHQIIVSRTMKRLYPQAIMGRVDMDCLTDGTRLLHLLQDAKYAILNGADAFLIGRDKSKAALALKKASIPHPKTWVLSRKDVGKMARRFQYPLVAKPIIGSGGEGVTLIESRVNLSLLSKHRFPLLIQEYCGPVLQDVRVVVLRGNVLGAVKRTPQIGEWRGNARLGASVVAIPVTDELERLATQAAAAIGADFAGIDLIKTEQGTFVIEVNVCPGFQSFCDATGIDVAKQVVLSLASLAKEKSVDRNNRGDTHEGMGHR